ncbi:MAG: hypothetical protein A2061_09885 [Gallionellales bacterium GWA2_59_43]|nr:MAG: hypothetical protein A2061_09885 [Gallionellales bacterium GWA2_59_43]
MKKIVLSIAGVLAATAFAPEASAIPAFARQTGMACNACHQQHYPVLNGFGQAFKAAGYTMMGAQEKIEGEHLSIPATLNAALLLKARYQKSNGVDPVGTVSGTTTNGGQWQIPDEFSLFFGGRVAENIGFMMENNTVGGPLGGIVAGFKIPVVFDMGAAKLSVIPFLTDALGVAYGYDESSTGMVRGIRWMEHRAEISAMQYVGNGAGAATGLAFVAKGDMGYINLTRFAPDFAAAGGATSPQLRSTFVRIAATPTMGDWAMHIGGAFTSGTSYTSGGTGGPLVQVDTKATSLDFQAQGQAAGKDLSLYATYARAPGTAAGALVGNLYNANPNASTAWTIGADYSVIPHVLHLGAAYRNADTGAVIVAPVVAGAATSANDDAISLSAVYDLTQNVALHLNYSAYSGGARTAAQGSSLTTFMLEAAW